MWESTRSFHENVTERLTDNCSDNSAEETFQAAHRVLVVWVFARFQSN